MHLPPCRLALRSLARNSKRPKVNWLLRHRLYHNHLHLMLRPLLPHRTHLLQKMHRCRPAPDPQRLTPDPLLRLRPILNLHQQTPQPRRSERGRPRSSSRLHYNLRIESHLRQAGSLHVAGLPLYWVSPGDLVA